MDWPGNDTIRPVIFNTRPARQQRDNHPGGHQTVYIDGNGLLIPAMMGQPLQRSLSASAHGGRRSPTQIVINNSQIDDHSPVRRSRRRSVNHDSRWSDEEWSEHEHSRVRRGRRERSRRRRSKSRSTSTHRKEEHHHHIELDPETRMRMEKLKKYEEEEDKAAQRKQYEQEQILKAAAEKAKKEKEEQLKKLAVAEYNTKQIEKEAKDRKDKEEADKAFQDRLKATFRNAGYSEESIERILEKEGKGDNAGQKKIMDLTRPTYIKVHRKYLSPDTLDVYELPWEWDDRDSSYIIIKRWIPEHEQDKLFEHTRKMRDGRLLTNRTVELKKERDQLLLVRRKSPARRRSVSRSWMFT